jgi:uncharacterized protein YndB with AHSA1/START domain
MQSDAGETRAVVVERELPYPAEKIWRALTQPHLLAEWLMKTDFQPAVGQRFQFRADWGAVDCQVVAIEANRTLSYTWAAHGLASTVTWTLTPKGTATHLRMEQVGFRSDQPQFYQGAQAGWPRFLDALAAVLARPAEPA